MIKDANEGYRHKTAGRRGTDHAFDNDLFARDEYNVNVLLFINIRPNKWGGFREPLPQVF